MVDKPKAPPAPKRVLVVDDDQDCCAALAFMLTELGFDCRTYPSGAKALQAMQREAFDISFIDVMMPEMNGYELVQAMRGIPQLAELPVIMLTARDSDSDLIEGYKGGADYYIPKPFNVSQVKYGLKLLLSPEEVG